MRYAPQMRFFSKNSTYRVQTSKRTRSNERKKRKKQ